MQKAGDILSNASVLNPPSADRQAHPQPPTMPPAMPPSIPQPPRPPFHGRGIETQPTKTTAKTDQIEETTKPSTPSRQIVHRRILFVIIIVVDCPSPAPTVPTAPQPTSLPFLNTTNNVIVLKKDRNVLKRNCRCCRCQSIKDVSNDGNSANVQMLDPDA